MYMYVSEPPILSITNVKNSVIALRLIYSVVHDAWKVGQHCLKPRRRFQVMKLPYIKYKHFMKLERYGPSK